MATVLKIQEIGSFHIFYVKDIQLSGIIKQYEISRQIQFYISK